MSRSSRLIAGTFIAILLAACGQAGDTITGPGGPAMSGYSTGGNREGSDTTAVTPQSTETTVASDTTGRSGYSTGGN